MQTLIAEHFREQTVIAIAHKLSAIVNYDKVAVLDKGTLVEFDRPSELLQKPDSAFKSLYESSRHTQQTV